MSWIQENKFAATLAGITVVGSAALLYLSIQQSGEEEAIRAKTKKLSKEEISLRNSKPFPSADNLKAKKEAVVDYANATVKLQSQLAEYRPTQVDDFQPSAFAPLLAAYRTDLNRLFEEAETKLPDQMFYGFEAYASRSPKEVATGELKYQMDASKWLFAQLAEASPERLINVYRYPLEVESGVKKATEKSPTSKKSSRKSRRNSKGKTKGVSREKPVTVYNTEPIELAFSIKEKGLISFLENVANSKEYFYTVKAIRIINEDQNSPSKSSAKFEQAQSSNSAASAFFTEGGGDGGLFAEPAEGEEKEVMAEKSPAIDKGKRILKRILGDENVQVILKLELIIFESKEKVIIPGSTVEMKETASQLEEGK